MYGFADIAMFSSRRRVKNLLGNSAAKLHFWYFSNSDGGNQKVCLMTVRVFSYTGCRTISRVSRTDIICFLVKFPAKLVLYPPSSSYTQRARTSERFETRNYPETSSRLINNHDKGASRNDGSLIPNHPPFSTNNSRE